MGKWPSDTVSPAEKKVRQKENDQDSGVSSGLHKSVVFLLRPRLTRPGIWILLSTRLCMQVLTLEIGCGTFSMLLSTNTFDIEKTA